MYNYRFKIKKYIEMGFKDKKIIQNILIADDDQKTIFISRLLTMNDKNLKSND